MDYIHIDDEPGNRQVTISYEAVVRHAITDPDLRGAVYEDTERVGCKFRAERSSPSLLAARGGGSKPTRRTTEGHGPVPSQIFLLVLTHSPLKGAQSESTSSLQ